MVVEGLCSEVTLLDTRLALEVSVFGSFVPIVVVCNSGPEELDSYGVLVWLVALVLLCKFVVVVGSLVVLDFSLVHVGVEELVIFVVSLS